MTVTAPATYPEQFVCNGSLVAFDFSFGVSATSEIEVIHTVDATGVETTLVETTDYTASTTNDDYSSGGTITTVSTYASGITLTIRMLIAFTQATDFVENMPTLYEAFETALDKLTRAVQQLDEHLDRALTFAKTSTELGEGLLPDPEALKFVRWNSAGTAFENLAATAASGTLAIHEADSQQHHGVANGATIAGGVLTVLDSSDWVKVTGEGGVDDTIDSIAGLAVGAVVELTPSSDSVTITVAHSSSMLLAGGIDFTMNNQYDNIVLRCIAAGLVFREISRMNRGG